jgi:hypothetical protein
MRSFGQKANGCPTIRPIALAAPRHENLDPPSPLSRLPRIGRTLAGGAVGPEGVARSDTGVSSSSTASTFPHGARPVGSHRHLSRDGPGRIRATGVRVRRGQSADPANDRSSSGNPGADFVRVGSPPPETCPSGSDVPPQIQFGATPLTPSPLSARCRRCQGLGETRA